MIKFLVNNKKSVFFGGFGGRLNFVDLDIFVNVFFIVDGRVYIGEIIVIIGVIDFRS